MSLKRPPSPSSYASYASQHTLTAPPSHKIYTCPSPIYDRKSTFTAYFSPSMPPDALRKHLKSLPEIKSATHHILAWRVPVAERGTIMEHFTSSNPTGREAEGEGGAKGEGKMARGRKLLDTGSDDDGENYGGRTVLRVLEGEGVQGSVIVARWFGNVMLGPVRFRHMEDVARSAIGEWKRECREVGQGVGDGKRLKGSEGRPKVDEAEVKARLAKELSERDANIVVLRELLREKKERVMGSREGGDGRREGEGASSQRSATPIKKIDYEGMTLDDLRRVDKARDSTVAFLLKKIEEVENAKVQSGKGLDGGSESSKPSGMGEGDGIHGKG